MINPSLAKTLVFGAAISMLIHSAPVFSANEPPAIDFSDIQGSFPYQQIEFSLSKLDKAWFVAAPGERKDKLARLATDIEGGAYPPTDSVLVSHNNQLVFESYYAYGRVNLPHFQASATKSYTSFAIGRAIQLGYLSMDDLHRPVLSFFTDMDKQQLVAGVEKVTLHHALAMRSGLRFSEQQIDAIEDMGKQHPANIEKQKLLQAYFTRTAPVTDETQSFYYQTADTHIAMLVLDAVVPKSAKDFISTELLSKLGIDQYFWSENTSNIPEAAYGTSMTSRDMVKWGQLLAQNGHWDNEQLVSSDYLAQATKLVAQPVDEDGDFDYSNFHYGYYFWGTQFTVADKLYDANMAWGGAGQYIVSVNALDLVIVVTARGRGLEANTLDMIETRILPLFV